MDGDELAASLGAHLDRLAFVDRTPDQVTELLIDAVVEWGRAQGFRVYRRPASVVPLPPPYEHQRSVVDVGCARPEGAPVVIEVDHADRKRTLDKLAAEAAAGRIALWVRWGTGRFATPPPSVHLVGCQVAWRTGLAGRGRLHSRTANSDRPAPRHTEVADDYTPEAIAYADPDADAG